MPKVLGVRFRTSPRMYYFAPADGVEYNKGDKVVVETQRGIELATVVLPVTDVEEDNIVAPLKPVLRIADEKDLEAEKADLEQKQGILATAKQKVAERGLDMKIFDCEFTVDHSKLVLYFTAEQRVDFRELVRDLASAFHMRIDLRQIGAREECKLIGSLGACGMPCCCGRFESDSEHVSIKMAKNQNLALTPNKINGMCGRLMCCLGYENKTYEDVLRRSPKNGSFVTCADGRRGTVVSVTPLTEKVRVRVGDEDSFEFVECDLNSLSFERREQKQEDGQAKDNNNGNANGGQAKNRKNKNKPKNNDGGNKPAAAEEGGNGADGGNNFNKKNRNNKHFNKNKNNAKKNGGNNQPNGGNNDGETAQ